MKKILYSFAVLLGLCAVGCSEVDNLGSDGDTAPAVTIYAYDIPAGTNPDATVNLRFIPNLICDKYYVLVEKKADKDAFVASNGEQAYTNKVVETGVQYPAEVKEYLNETLESIYAITAVGIGKDGATGKPFEFIFNGVDWQEVGTALYSDASFNTVTNAPAKWYQSTNLETVVYKLTVTLSAWSGYERTIKLNWDAEGALTFYTYGQASPRAGFWMLPTPFTHASYGAYWQEIDLAPDYSYYDSADNTIYMDTRRVVSAGTFTGWYAVKIVLP